MDVLILSFTGIVAGMAGSLLGVGGGFVIIPILSIFFPALSHLQISAISLLCVFVNALAGFFLNFKSRKIDYKTGFLFAAFSIPGSIIAVSVAEKIPLKLFSICLGFLFLAASLLLFRNSMKSSFSETSGRTDGRFKIKIVDATGHTFYYSYNPYIACLISFVTGFLSSLFGIGGGIFFLPIFISYFHIPVKIATATSLFILFLSSCSGSMTYLFEGTLSGLSIGYGILPVGIILGGWLGNRFSRLARPIVIIRIFSGLVFFIGLKFIFEAIIVFL